MTISQKPAEKPTSTKLVATTAAAAAVREELRALLTAEPFGIQQLTNIEGIARAGKMLLQATQGHPAQHLSQMGSGIGVNYYSASDGMAMPAMPIPNQNETFGAKALRELGAVLKRAGDKSRTRMTILRELSLARKEGLEDIAAELKGELEDLKNVDARLAGDKPGVVQELEGLAS